ncbi:MAG: hypothetical protein JSR80_01520 [Verrucomicrobia bacterium]|nr:hypothetical protein [Verrucomicrobiota bacterium]
MMERHRLCCYLVAASLALLSGEAIAVTASEGLDGRYYELSQTTLSPYRPDDLENLPPLIEAAEPLPPQETPPPSPQKSENRPTLRRRIIGLFTSPSPEKTPETQTPSAPPPPSTPPANEGYLINFNNVPVSQYVRFISQITGTNFIFNEEDLQFNVTIVSEEPTGVDYIMSALLQVLQVHGLNVAEQGNQVIIYKDAHLAKLATVVSGRDFLQGQEEPPIQTRVFYVNNASVESIAQIVKPLLSENAVVQTSKETSHLVVTDISGNVERVQQLLDKLDAPTLDLEVGEYHARSLYLDALVELATKILEPLGGGAVSLVPQAATGTIYVVASPVLVQRALSILESLDASALPPTTGGTLPPFGETFSETRVLPGGGASGGPYIPPGLGGAYHAIAKGKVGGQGGFSKSAYQESTYGGIAGQPGGAAYEGSSMNQVGGHPGTTYGTTSYGGTAVDQIGGKSVEGFYGATAEGIAGPLMGQLSGSLEGGLAPTSFRQRAQLDTTTFYIYKLQFHQGNEIKTALQEIADSLEASGATNSSLVSTIGTIQWIQSSNSLVISGNRSSIEKVKELIQDLDIPLEQVFIEVLILRTTIANALRIGVEWGYAQQFIDHGNNPTVVQSAVGNTLGGTGTAVSALNARLNPANAPAPWPPLQQGIELGIIGRFVSLDERLFSSVGAFVNALQNDTDLQILLNPKILTQDNHTARIFVGTNVAFQESTISEPGSTILSGAIEYRDVGSELVITPILGTGDIVTLEISQTVESFDVSSNFTTTSTSNSNQGTTQPVLKSQTETRVSVPDGYFLVLSGQIEDSQSRTHTGLPCLGGLPILGAAFSNKSETLSKDNLIIFVRPHIIRTKADMVRVTEQERLNFEYSSDQNSYCRDREETLELLNVIPRQPMRHDHWFDPCYTHDPCDVVCCE